MDYRKLGNSGLEISCIGFGCMSLKDEALGISLIQKAAGSGMNYFDTADLYDKGANEVIVGKALKEKRKDIILATKVGNQWRNDGTGWDWNPTKKYILQAVEKSLQRLQTDYIDLYQLHGGTIDDPVDETIEAFELLKQQGKIRYYGISSIRPNVIRTWLAKSDMVSVMLQYSLLDRRPEEEVLSLLQSNKIGVLTRGSVAQGLLINKEPGSYLYHSSESVQKAANAIKERSSDNRTPSQTATRFVLCNPAVTSAVIGIRTPQQLDEAIHTLNSPELTTEDWNALNQSAAVGYYQEHR